ARRRSALRQPGRRGGGALGRRRGAGQRPRGPDVPPGACRPRSYRAAARQRARARLFKWPANGADALRCGPAMTGETTAPQKTGQLYGLGIGPGDPELVTLKALRLMRAASVVAYPAPEGSASFARSIAARWLDQGQREIRIDFPMRPGPPPAA